MPISDIKRRVDRLEKQLKPKDGANWRLYFYDDFSDARENCVNLPVKSDDYQLPQWEYTPPAPIEDEAESIKPEIVKPVTQLNTQQNNEVTPQSGGIRIKKIMWKTGNLNETSERIM